MANFNFDPSFFMQAYLNSKHQGWQSGENAQDRAQREKLQREELEAQRQRQAERQDWATGERIGGQDWQSEEAGVERDWRTGERIGGQNWQSGEGLLERTFRTNERLGSQDWTGQQNAYERSLRARLATTILTDAAGRTYPWSPVDPLPNAGGLPLTPVESPYGQEAMANGAWRYGGTRRAVPQQTLLGSIGDYADTNPMFKNTPLGYLSGWLGWLGGNRGAINETIEYNSRRGGETPYQDWLSAQKLRNDPWMYVNMIAPRR